MYSADDILPSISLADIQSKISDMDIFQMYIKNFKELRKAFCSELREDKNPSCYIYVSGNGALRMKDFGNGDNLGAFDYVQKKFYCNFSEALRIVSNDFGLYNVKRPFYKPEILLGRESVSNELKMPLNPIFKPKIEIVPRQWNLYDYNFWTKKYSITFDKLEEFDVIPCKSVFLYKKDKTIEFTNTNSNPIYAYKFTKENGEYSYKIYFPLAEKKRKWLFSGGTQEDIEGFSNLPLIGNKLILTKSLKDCICFNLIGYPAISLQGETNKLSKDLVYKLLKRFNEIIVCYDSDKEGIKNTLKLHNQYGFKYFYIDKYKDLSDYIEHKSIEEAKLMINNKLINGK